MSLVSAGMGVSPMTISPFASWLITAYDWRTAMFEIGIVAWVLLIPAVFLVRQPPAAQHLPPRGTERRKCSGPSARRCAPRNSSCWRWPFRLLRGAFGADLPHGELCDVCGVAPMAAVTVYSLAGFSGLGGRLLLGVLADRLGVKPVLVAGCRPGDVVAAYLAVGQLGEFYAWPSSSGSPMAA